MASRIVPAALMGIGADLAGKLASPHLLQGSLRLHACRISALLSGRWRETGFLGQGDRAIAFGTGNDCRRCVAAPPPKFTSADHVRHYGAQHMWNYTRSGSSSRRLKHASISFIMVHPLATVHQRATTIGNPVLGR
jgi:hypothetical protein